MPSDESPSRVRRGLRAAATEVVRASTAAFLMYCLLFNLSVVRGNSMAPGIQDGDRILVEPWSYLVDDIERGDVIVLRYPLDPSVDYIKRVVGLPGDEVFVCNGTVWVNGKLLDEPYVEFSGVESPMKTVVSEDSYFVMGDNRPRSSDSREFGLVPAELVRGRVDVRLWPPQRAGIVR
jgi:signal peptidase I